MAVTQIKDAHSDNQLTVNADGSINIGNAGSITGTVTSNEAALSAFATSQYTVGTTSVQVTPAPLIGRKSISMRAKCAGGTSMYIGPTSAVTIGSGWLLLDGDILTLDLDNAHTVYAIADADGQTLYALELA